MAAVAGPQGGEEAQGDASRPSTGTTSSHPLQSSNTSMQSEISDIQREFDKHHQWLKENAPEGVLRDFQALTEREFRIHQTLTQEPQLPNQQLQELQNTVNQVLQTQQSQQNQLATIVNPKQARVQTWAQLVAQAPSSTLTPQDTLVTTKASTVSLITRPVDEQSPFRDLTNKQVTEKYQAAIPGALTASKLPSGDVRVTFENPTQKEQAIVKQSQIRQKLGVKVIREDFPVEVLGVPTTFLVPLGREDDSKPAIDEIKERIARLIPGFDVTRLN